MSNQLQWSDFISKKEMSINNKSIKEIRRHEDGRLFMVKVTVANYDDHKYFQNERKYLSRINHDNIVKFYGATINSRSKGLIITEYADNGTLYDFLYVKVVSRLYQDFIHTPNIKDHHISYSCKLSWMVQCAMAVAYLHEMSPKIFHNDLKPRHLLLSNNFQTLKLCDFSTATESQPSDHTGSYNPNVFSEKTDIYSFGIVLWETFISNPNSHRNLDVKDAEVIEGVIKLCCDIDAVNRPKMRVLGKILDGLYRQCISDNDIVSFTALEIEKPAIGFGVFGEVFKAAWKTKKGIKNIAVKRIRNIDQDMNVEREVECLALANHENIVKFFGSTKDYENQQIIVMEYADCGSLYNFLHCQQKDNRLIQVSNFGKLNWMLQCAKGIAYLHQLRPKPILHRDLKSHNLLLFNENLILKICDFGSVRPLATLMTSVVGTAAYMAPEVGKGEPYTEKCDVYSFGILCWEILSAKKPFYHVENGNNWAIITKVGNNDRPLIDDVEKNDETKPIREWIQQCWDKNPEERPAIIEMVTRLGIDPISYIEYNLRPLPAITSRDFSKLEMIRPIQVVIAD